MENPVDDTLGRSFQFGIHGEALLVGHTLLIKWQTTTFKRSSLYRGSSIPIHSIIIRPDD
jgi:hypothetical protein